MIYGLDGVRKWSVFGLLLLCHLYFFQIYPHFISTNEWTRFLLVTAIVDDRSVSIDHAISKYGDTQDKSGFQGRYYADKAIGTSVIGIVPYLFVKGISAVLAVNLSPKILMFLLRVICVTIPALLFLNVLTRFWEDVSKNQFLVRSLAFVLLFGTVAFTYSLQYISHYLFGIFLFVSFFFIYRCGQTPAKQGKLLFWSGVFSGAALMTEYPAVFPVSVLILYLLWKIPSKRASAMYLVGILPFPILMLAYNYLIFGTPFELTYRHQTAARHVWEHSQGFIGLGWPRPEAFWGLLFSRSHGMFFFSPVLLFSVPGFILAFKEKRWRKEVIAFTGIILSIVVFHCSMSNWDGGWAFGPRYLTPVVPFLMTGTLFFFSSVVREESASSRSSRWLFVLIFTSVLSIGLVTIGTITFPFPPREFENPLFTLHLPLLLNGGFSRNLGQLFAGSGPAIFFWTLLLITWIVMCLPQSQLRRPLRGAVLHSVGAIVLAVLVLIAGYVSREPPDAFDHYASGTIHFFVGNYEDSRNELLTALNSSPDAHLKRLIDIRIHQLIQEVTNPAKEVNH